MLNPATFEAVLCEAETNGKQRLSLSAVTYYNLALCLRRAVSVFDATEEGDRAVATAKDALHKIAALGCPIIKCDLASALNHTIARGVKSERRKEYRDLLSYMWLRDSGQATGLFGPECSLEDARSYQDGCKPVRAHALTSVFRTINEVGLDFQQAWGLAAQGGFVSDEPVRCDQ